LEQSFAVSFLVGWAKVSWPFGRLDISPSRLRLRGFGAYDFSPEQVERIEYASYFLAWDSSLRIRHHRTDYPQKVMILSLGTRGVTIAKAIVQSGFLPAERVGVRPAAPALRSWVLPLLLLVCLLPGLALLTTGLQHGVLVALASFSVCGLVVSTALRASSVLQAQVLRPGREYAEIEVAVFVTQMVCVALLLGVAALSLAVMLAAR